jgi:FSR family fosmidomycin resistance protein-like MFS transporter
MRKKDKITLTALCAAHFVNDSYSSIIYPLLPLIQDKLALTNSEVYWLAPLYAISSSLMQPVYGIISDRYARRFFAVFGPAITAVFVSMIGLAPSYGALIVVLVGGGIGIGAFHPQAAAMASQASGNRKRMGMAMFSAIGTLGFAFGPLVITRVVERVQLENSYYIVITGLITSAVLYFICPPLESQNSPGIEKIKGQFRSALKLAWQPLLLLYLITVIRSALQITTNTYMPFLLRQDGYGLAETGNVLTVFLLLGGLGGLAGGYMAERVSGRAVTFYSGLFAGPLMMGAFLTSGPVSMVLLGMGGFVLLSTIPVNVAMAQELVPGQTSTVSALMMGAAWGVGALAPPLLDNLVPLVGRRNVLVIMAAATLFSAVCAYMLPRDEQQKKEVVQSDMATAAAGD